MSPSLNLPPDMSPLLNLPRELRDQIWALICHREHKWSSYGSGGPRTAIYRKSNASQSFSSHSVLQLCRQICYEVTPFLYQTVCVSVVHPNQIIRWLGSIGARNSSCIRHLVIRFTSLLLNFNQKKYIEDRILAWAAALRALPKLVSLTFDFEQDPKVSMIWGTFDNDKEILTDAYNEMLAHDPVVGDELAKSATAWAQRLNPRLSKKAESWEYRPELSERPVTHAIMAMDESIPPVLLQYFATLLQLTSTSSLGRDVTGLPAKFFEDSGLYLARTYAFNEDPVRPSVSMSFGRDPWKDSSPSTSLRIMLDQLPHLVYLYVGCRNIDSSFLAHLPLRIQTLDVAFTDVHPVQIATNLQTMRKRCGKLFTLAIAVSPLHDRELSDNKEGKFFKRQSLDKDITEKWEPFWSALENLKSTGIRVWEGEGPGFKRQKVDRST